MYVVIRKGEIYGEYDGKYGRLAIRAREIEDELDRGYIDECAQGDRAAKREIYRSILDELAKDAGYEGIRRLIEVTDHGVFFYAAGRAVWVPTLSEGAGKSKVLD